MRLLIVTQAVDLDDPVLGFFHRWITELAKRYERVSVICLKEGRHELPSNVRVYSLGKESGRSRTKYIARFFRYIIALRNDYDAVFVHMNAEYVVFGGVFWKLWHKRVYLWRNHYAASRWADIAALFCNTMFSTSPNSYIVKYRKTVLMPVGIDTAAFTPPAQEAEAGSILFLGRLDSSKRAHIFVRALEWLHEKHIRFNADIVGDPTEHSSTYAREVREAAAPLVRDGVLALHSGVTNDEARALFASHAIYVNLSPQGMFDKTILEAASSGCLLVATNESVRGVVPEILMPAVDDADSTARALEAALELSEADRRAIAVRLRAFVLREHSLGLLAEKLERAMAQV